MREVSLRTYKALPNGKKRMVDETWKCYTKAEADAIGLVYHANWRERYLRGDLVKGDYMLTEEDPPNVLPCVYSSKVPCGRLQIARVKTPFATFNPFRHNYPLSSIEHTDRHSFHKTHYASGRTSERALSYLEISKVKRVRYTKAAWLYARTGDEVKAYIFSHAGSPAIKRLSTYEIGKRARSMVSSTAFRELLMAELEVHWDAAGITPAKLLKKLFDRITDDDLDFDKAMEGSKFLLALHKDFKADVVPLITGQTGVTTHVQNNDVETADYTELLLEVQPGSQLLPHQKSFTEAKEDSEDEHAPHDTDRDRQERESAGVDDLVSEDVSDEQVLEEEERRGS